MAQLCSPSSANLLSVTDFSDFGSIVTNYFTIIMYILIKIIKLKIENEKDGNMYQPWPCTFITFCSLYNQIS